MLCWQDHSSAMAYFKEKFPDSQKLKAPTPVSDHTTIQKTTRRLNAVDQEINRQAKLAVDHEAGMEAAKKEGVKLACERNQLRKVLAEATDKVYPKPAVPVVECLGALREGPSPLQKQAMEQNPGMAQLFEQLKELQLALKPQLEKMDSIEKTFKDKFEEIMPTLAASTSEEDGGGARPADTPMANKGEELSAKD